MRTPEIKALLLDLAADVRAGRYEADYDLGKSEHLGESQRLAAAYEDRARPILKACRSRGVISDDELAALLSLGHDRQRAADRLQALAECLLVD